MSKDPTSTAKAMLAVLSQILACTCPAQVCCSKKLCMIQQAVMPTFTGVRTALGCSFGVVVHLKFVNGDLRVSRVDVILRFVVSFQMS